MIMKKENISEGVKEKQTQEKWISFAVEVALGKTRPWLSSDVLLVYFFGKH